MHVVKEKWHVLNRKRSGKRKLSLCVRLLQTPMRFSRPPSPTLLRKMNQIGGLKGGGGLGGECQKRNLFRNEWRREIGGISAGRLEPVDFGHSHFSDFPIFLLPPKQRSILFFSFVSSLFCIPFRSFVTVQSIT